jgi:predicted phosphodiesterase
MTRRRLLIITVPLAILALGLAAWQFLPIQTEAFLERLFPWSESFPKQPYVQDAGPTAMTIFYEAKDPGQGSVEYTTGRHFDQTAPAELREEIQNAKSTTYLYRARLESLTPATPYKYRVVHVVQGKKAKSRIATFRTWPEKGRPVTFIVYGDTWSAPEQHAVMARQFGQYHPDFIVHTGDIISARDAYEKWERKFFEPLEAVLGSTPVMVVCGNHDPQGHDFLRWFEFPGERTWYSFTCGAVHVAVLDCYDYTPEVARWLDQDLAASQSPWKIVAYHEPTINFGGHVSQWGRDLLPILAKHDVDLVLAGHSHVYERFVPLRLNASSPHATTFVTTAGGGAELYAVVQHPLLLKAASLYHYCVVQADAGRLTMRVLTPKGEEVDRWTVAKTDGRLDATYLAQAKPVDAAILAEALVQASAVSVAGVKDQPDEADVAVRVQLPGLFEPATLSARLADSCAGAYEANAASATVNPGTDGVLKIKIRRLSGAPQSKGAPAEAVLNVTIRVGAVEQSAPFKMAWPKTAP